MPVDLTAVLDKVHESTEQETFRLQVESHNKAMDAAAAHEDRQYDEVLRQLQLFAQIKPQLTTAQGGEIGLRVGAKTAEMWAAKRAKTAAILTAIADATGVRLADVLADISAAALPAEVRTARAAIASAAFTDA